MKRSLLLSLFAIAIVAMTLGQAMATVTVSLNLRYTNPNSTAAGGTWDLKARTDSAFGLSTLIVVLDNVNSAGITLNTGIGALPIELQTSGTLVEFVYGQDPGGVAGTSKFANVGKGAGTPGNVAKDDLFSGAANSYDNMALIASGSFGAVRPSFGTFPGSGPTEGADWIDAALTEASDTVPTLTLGGGDGVRGDSVAVDGLRQGDANRDGIVNTGDLSLLLTNFNGTPRSWDQGNFNGPADTVVNTGDLSLLLTNFNGTTPSPAIGAVPEPSAAVLALIALGLGVVRRRV
jgi:hypothetical protein